MQKHKKSLFMTDSQMAEALERFKTYGQPKK